MRNETVVVVTEQERDDDDGGDEDQADDGASMRPHVSRDEEDGVGGTRQPFD